MVKASNLCNEYGMDVVEVGTEFLGQVMECFDKGSSPERRRVHQTYEWGSAEGPLEPIEMVACRKRHRGPICGRDQDGFTKDRRRFGSIRSDGEGAGRPNRDPESKGWGLAYAVSSRGQTTVEPR